MRDVTKVLSDAEFLKLRAILDSNPQIASDPHAFGEYPKMLFGPNWYRLYVVANSDAQALDAIVAKKQAGQMIRNEQVIVHDLEQEEDFLADGWKSDPNDLVIAATGKDPRVPTGREGRRAKSDLAQQRAQELADIRRRYAALTGRKLLDEDTVDDLPPVEVPLEEPVLEAATSARVPPSEKRARVQAARARATRSSAHA